MNELSLHILDIAQNSIKAKATLIEIELIEDTKENTYQIIIKDNGCGMSKEILEKVTDPFYTTRTTRDVGLGISLFKMAAEQTEGTLTIDSVLNEGTILNVIFAHDHIDRAPLGDMSETLSILVLTDDKIDFVYKHSYNESTYVFDTREIKEVLDGIPFTDYSVMMWIKNNIKEGILDIYKEETK